MRLHILKELIDGPWGGGNQFLKNLRNAWRAEGIYAESPVDAQGILLNSHHNLPDAVILKYRFPEKVFVHRLDGPIYLGRKNGQKLDNFIFYAAGLISEGVVFQSAFSRGLCLAAGMKTPQVESTIMNAPDPNLFYPKKGHKIGKKGRLIATSWSTNSTKGFDIYEFLDQHLDFERFQMTFVGNSSVQFKNIQLVPPQNSADLAMLLREHDIFITASRVDPCSNSLVEGLHCGLPAVARKSGGHPEIVGEAGTLFKGEDDVIDAINKVADNYEFYRNRITLPNISQVAAQYHQVFKDAITARTTGRGHRLSLRSCISFFAKWGWLRANKVV